LHTAGTYARISITWNKITACWWSNTSFVWRFLLQWIINKYSCTCNEPVFQITNNRYSYWLNNP
jgi:hypothetical protein